MLALSFVLWGIGDIFTGSTSTAVATVGGTNIESPVFQRTYRNFIKGQAQQMGIEITPEMAQRMGLGQTVLQQVIDRVALDNYATRQGIVTSDTQVTDSRLSENGEAVKRRRKCLRCQRRFTTYERIERIGLTVVKKGNNDIQTIERVRRCEVPPPSASNPAIPRELDQIILKALQREIHESFIALVKERRGGKLDSRETALFSGAYWTGQRSLELGLVDAVGDLRTTLRERYGDKVQTPVIAERGFALLGRKASGVEQLLNGPNFADDMVATLEARALWSRFGL